MLAQLSAILVPPVGSDTNTFEKFLFEKALPATEHTVTTRITKRVLQSVLRGEEQGGGRTYYLWRAELDLMTEGGLVAPTLLPELFATMQEQLSTQNATLTSPLTLVQPTTQT